MNALPYIYSDEYSYADFIVKALEGSVKQKNIEQFLIQHKIEGFESLWKDEPKHDAVNQPKHYTSHPSGIECIQITEHYDFSIGNAIKYLWRAGLKQDSAKSDIQKEVEDLRKAIFYINRKIEHLEK